MPHKYKEHESQMTYSLTTKSGAKHSKFALACRYDLHPRANAMRNIHEYCRRVIWSSRCKFLKPELREIKVSGQAGDTKDQIRTSLVLGDPLTDRGNGAPSGLSFLCCVTCMRSQCLLIAFQVQKQTSFCHLLPSHVKEQTKSPG